MATIYIDGEPYEVKEGQNLLHACLSLGFNVPYFCWHPAMGSVGACRQCAVKQFKDENDTQGKIVMSCMTPAADGTRISIDDPEVLEFRRSVIEWLMVNHPHDCPVCDEGGECHLQDMTVMTGHDYRRFRFDKRTYRNQDIGPFVNHEMNRCIQCYRCVRFYADYAGGRDFGDFVAHDHVYFGRYEEGALESPFSGNLVEVCPTGVFTDKTLKKHYTRKWDLQTAPSVCVHCSLGCNTIPGERYGTLRRIRNRYNGEVNGYFLCDRGRYGYAFVNSAKRVREPLLRDAGHGRLIPVSKERALERAAALLRDAGRVVGIGSPRASLEANFALRRLVGADAFYQGVREAEAGLAALAWRILREGPARSASLQDVAHADAVLVLGEDVTNSAPMLDLALRQAVRRQPMRVLPKLKIPEWHDIAVRKAIGNRKGPLFIASPAWTELDSLARRAYRAAADDLARLGFAVAHALSPESPPVPDLPEEVESLAAEIAEALREAERPLVISGSGCGSEAVMQAAANVAWALSDGGLRAGLCLVAPECNTTGTALLGGKTLDDANRELSERPADVLVLLENDLYRRADAESVDTLFRAADHVIVLDHLQNATAERAEVVLPVGTFAESDGTLVNNEGRAQRFFQVFVPSGEVQESWRWLRDLMAAAGREHVPEWNGMDDVIEAMVSAHPDLSAVRDAAPPASFRILGARVPRESHRYSGRTAILADVTVHEAKPPDDPDAPLSFSMEGYEGQPPSPLIPRFWSPGWNSVQAVNKFQEEVAGPLRGGNPGTRLVEPKQGAEPHYFDGVPEATEVQAGEFVAVPVYHIYGSEELSIHTEGIAERAPQPYIGLHPEDALAQGLACDDEVHLSVDEKPYRLPVQFVEGLPRGLAALPIGLQGLPGVQPSTRRVKLATRSERSGRGKWTPSST